MTITCRCACGGVFEFQSEDVGKAFRCGNCGTRNVVELPQRADVSNAVTASEAPSTFAPIPEPRIPQPETATGQNPAARLVRIGGPVIVTIICIAIAIVSAQWVWNRYRESTVDVSRWAGFIEGIDQLGDVDEIMRQYEQRGYVRVMGEAIVETEPVVGHRLYACRNLELRSDSQADLAIIAQSATIAGVVNGNLDFLGQSLVIEKNAVIKGDVRSRIAQLITVKGRIEGSLSGDYQALNAAASQIEGGIE